MIWPSLTIVFAVISLLMLVFFLQTRRVLKNTLSANKQYSSFQKTFSKAVEGIEASLESEKQTSANFIKILESIQDGVALMDSGGMLKYANPALWKLYAIPAERQREYMNESWINLHSPKGQEEIRNIVLPVLREKGRWIGESDVLASDGSMIRAELFISKTGEGYIGFIRNVTDRYKAELDRENLALQLHQLQKSDAVERVVRALVHEFNNGLASVNGYAEILMEDLEGKPDAQEYASKIYHSGQQMQLLLEQARMLVPGEKTVTMQKSDLVSIVPSAIGELKKRLPEDFEIENDINLSVAEVNTDGPKICQLVMHILENAIESGDQDKIITLEIDLHRPSMDLIESTNRKLRHYLDRPSADRVRLQYGFYDPSAEYVQMTVIDQGSGIPFPIMEHILDPFFSTKKTDRKSGLGMSIVSSVLRQCKGYLLIDSIQGRGTRVTVLLPAVNTVLSGGSRSTKAIIRLLSQEIAESQGDKVASSLMISGLSFCFV